MLDSHEDILKLTKELVQVRSVVNTEGEADISNKIYQKIASYPYFSDHPDLLYKMRTIDDDIERYNVFATVKGTKSKSDQTVILMGHMDTVGVDDFGQLQDMAYFPGKLMNALSEEPLPHLVEDHLQSEEWYFGRGTLDMKAGIASNLYLLKYYSEHPEELTGNLMFLAACDEEDGSRGILSAVKELKRIKQEHSFDYVGIINADFVSPRYAGDENRYVYKGAIGKLLPSFLVAGIETHAGSPFEGLDPNFIVAEITKQISYNPDLSDQSSGEFTVPPVSLKQTDLKPTYTIQTALSAFVYFNFFTHSWTPKQVLTKLKVQAKIAVDRAMSIFNERRNQFSKMSHQLTDDESLRPSVFIYEDLHNQLIKEHGNEFLEHMKQFKEALLLDRTLDTRMYATRVVEEECKWIKDGDPVVVLYYSSLYSPHVALNKESKKEANLLHALEIAVESVQPYYPHPIVINSYFPYVCDMSFVSLEVDEREIRTIEENNPAWGRKHYVDYQDMVDLNIPSINIGPYGYDAHSRFERMEKEYSTKIVPNIANRVIQMLLMNDNESKDMNL